MKHKPVKQSNFFGLREGRTERKKRICDRCREGTFMAEHEDRWYCGKCGLTIWKENKLQKT